MTVWRLDDEALKEFSARIVKECERSRSFEPALSLFFQLLKDTLSAFKLCFWRFTPNNDAVVNELVLGEVKDGVKLGDRIPLDSEKATLFLSFLSHKPKVLPAEQIRKMFVGETLVENHCVTCYFIPLFIYTELLGCFSVESSAPPVSQKVLSRLENFVSAVGFAFSGVYRETRATKRLLQMRLLHQITERALMRLDLKDLLDTAVTLLKNYFLYYNVYIFIYKPEEDALVMTSMAGEYADKIKLPFILKPSEGCVGTAFRTRKTYYCRDVREDPTYVCEIPGVREALSEIAVPIMQGTNILGVLDVQVDKPNSFDQFDIESMETLASEIASAIIRAYDYEILRNYSTQLESYQIQMERDLKISEQILSMNLPRDFISVFLDHTLYFRAHHSIGGDIVLLKSSDEYCYVIVGDVSGHGISSALISTSTYSYLNNVLVRSPSVETLVYQFNQFWQAHFKDLGYYVTMFAGRLHNLSGNFEYINCAHPPPFYYSTETRSVVPMERQLPPVGLFELDSDAEIQRSWIRLHKDDRLVFYTDGLLREYPLPSRFREEDLKTAILRFGHYPEEIFHQFLLWTVQKSSKEITSADDEVLLTMCYTGSPTVSGYVENAEHALTLTRKVNLISSLVGIDPQTITALEVLLEETLFALLARKNEAVITPRIFVHLDFLPRKFNLRLLDANLFLQEEGMAQAVAEIPPFEEQLPLGTLKLIKGKMPSVEIKKIEKGLLFVYPCERVHVSAYTS